VSRPGHIVKPPPFEYLRAVDLEAALTALREYGDEAKPVAGGQSLVPLLNLRLARPSLLIDINDLPLDDVRVEGGTLTTGALVRHRSLALDPELARAHPMLAQAAKFIGHTAIRNRGTAGGSLVHADPAAELPLVALVGGATMVLRSATGEREVTARDYFLGPYMTDTQPDELLVGTRWPVIDAATSWGFSEVAERTGDFALAAAAIVVRRGEPAWARVGVTGVPGSPVRLDAVEAAWRESSPSSAELRLLVRDELAARFPPTEAGPSAHVRRLVEEMVVQAGRQARDTGSWQ
jgi:CO/xanthine dehydrogenase FAD-binding subunit